MRRLLFIFAAVLCCQTASAQFNPNAQIGENDSNQNEGMVFALPTGPETLYLTIVTHDEVQPGTRDAQVLAWFDQDPRLAKLKKQCHTNHYWHSHPHYATPQGKGGLGRCWGIGYPLVVVTRKNGEILQSAYFLNEKGQRGKLPDRSSDLADMFWTALDKKLEQPTFKSHSASPASVMTTTGYPCPPNDPYCPNPVGPDPNSPTIPEVVDPSWNWFATLKDIAPFAIVLVLIALAGGLYLRDRQAKSQASSNPFFS